MKPKTASLCLGGLALAGVVLSGFIPMASASEPEAIKVGLLWPWIGLMAFAGQQQEKRSELAIEEINAGCGSAEALADAFPRASVPLKGILAFAGSTSVQPLAAKLGEAFHPKHPGVTFDIAAGGSVVGIQAVHDGTVDVGMASRELTDEEAEGISTYIIGVDVLAVVAHGSNPVQSLTMEQLKKIYTGQITDWKEVGGLEQPITVVIREKTSGTRGAFDHVVLAGAESVSPGLKIAITAGDVVAAVKNDPTAIGYVGFGNIEEHIQLIAIDGILPTIETVHAGDYSLLRPLKFMVGPLSQPIAMNFIDFVLSPEGQKLVAGHGWIPGQ